MSDKLENISTVRFTIDLLPNLIYYFYDVERLDNNEIQNILCKEYNIKLSKDNINILLESNIILQELKKRRDNDS